jgi:cellulose synthase/poly-beta-1,6-N-acetylglucosamine synthase-like glycosyltransferase
MPVFLFIFFLLLLGYAFLIDYYRRSWNSIPVYDEVQPVASVPVSVVIAVRNEEHHIRGLLKSLGDQSYPKTLYEIIIVDDHSDDGTWEILIGGEYRDLNMNALKAPARAGAGSSFKKYAISAGIAVAKGELIVTTDADCQFHKDWLAVLTGFYKEKNAAFIAAPVMITNTGSLLSIFQALDFLSLQGITGASVHRHFHSMCNGANLAYTRSAFIEVNGFEGIDHIPSGDDMLLMHKIYNSYPGRVFYLKSWQAIVRTEPALSWKAFFHQRIRWASKSVHYKDKRIFRVLLLVYLVNCCFLVLGIASFWNGTWLFFFLLLLLAKLMIEFPFVNLVSAFFGQTGLMKFFPFLQPLHILYTIIAGWLGRFGSYEWKGRKIKT